MGKDLKGKNLGTGISQRRDGCYQGRFVNRFGDRQAVYGQTVKEVKNKLSVAKAEDVQKKNVVNPNLTLDQWYEKWMRVYKNPVVRANTIRQYRYVYEHNISPFIGKRKLIDITKLIVVDLMNELKDKGYEWESLNKVKVLLTDMFDRAIEDEFAVRNPAKGARNPRNKPQKEIKALSQDDQRTFFQCSAGTFYDNLFRVAVNSGLRPGDDDDKIRLNQRKPSKYKGLRRFGPEKNLQRINKFMKERPIFYKNLIQMKENIRFYLRCFYCITKVMILQFNSENRTELARNG